MCKIAIEVGAEEAHAEDNRIIYCVYLGSCWTSRRRRIRRRSNSSSCCRVSFSLSRPVLLPCGLAQRSVLSIVSLRTQVQWGSITTLDSQNIYALLDWSFNSLPAGTYILLWTCGSQSNLPPMKGVVGEVFFAFPDLFNARNVCRIHCECLRNHLLPADTV